MKTKKVVGAGWGLTYTCAGTASIVHIQPDQELKIVAFDFITNDDDRALSYGNWSNCTHFDRMLCVYFMMLTSILHNVTDTLDEK